MDGTEAMFLGMTLVLTLGTVSVALLRPLTRQLGKLLEAMAQERSRPVAPPDLERVRELLEGLHGRLDRIEERQDFTDALLGGAKDPRGLRSRSGASDATPREG